ncbi:MAG: DNRLRE domain-containing protein [Deltaproteobacteria bacterium]|nr:DNRLRE domain-containing protein [Deltaproteobacteria bacterium]
MLAASCTRCDADAWCDTTADCPAQQRCFEGHCRPACAEDGQCAAGEQCHYGVCLPVGAGCDSANDCLGIETCVDGRCRLTCLANTDCPADQVCCGGLCEPDCQPNPDASADDRAGRDRPLSDGAGHDRKGSDGASPDRLISDSTSPDRLVSDSSSPDHLVSDSSRADRGVSDSAAPDPGTAITCAADPCQPTEQCLDLADGGYQCCAGAVCAGVCHPTWRCCDSSDCELPTSTCTGHLCQGTLVLQESTSHVVDDTWIDSYGPTVNHEGDGKLWVRATNEHVALVRFGLSALPAGSAISSAKLWLYEYDQSNDCLLDVGVFEMLTAWDADTATWNQASQGVPWNAAGCNGLGTDRASSPSGSYAGAVSLTWIHAEIGTLVQKWVEQPTTNFGANVRAIAGGCNVAHYFRSSDYVTVSLRPRLEISYIEP